MKTLICLKGNFEAQPIIERVRALGHRVVLVDPDPACAARWMADVYVQADHYDPAATLAALAAVPGLAPDGVLCCAGDTPHTAAAVAARYGLPGLTPGQAELSVDKYNQKNVLRNAGLSVPDFWEVARGWGKDQRLVMGSWGNKDISGWDHWHTRSIVKPRDNRGARGVALLPLKPDIQQIADALVEAEHQSPTSRAVIEEYLPGPQLSTESIVVDGRVLFTAIALRNYDRFERGDFGPHPVEDGFSMPFGDDAMRAEVDDVLARACAALGWKTLSVKADLIIHDGRVVILELAARLSGGFLSTHGTAYAYDFSFIDHAIRLALGQPVYVAHDSAPRQHVCQRYVMPDLADVGRRVVSVGELAPFRFAVDEERIQTWMGLAESGTLTPFVCVPFATYAIRPGDVIAPVVSHGQRWGQALATGATANEARARAEAAVAAMKNAVVLA